MEWWMIPLSLPVHSSDKSSYWLVVILSVMWGDWKKKGKKACKEERRQKREAWGWLKIEDRRMRISKKERKKGETKFRGLNDSGREARERERMREQEVTSIFTYTSTRQNNPLHLNQGIMARFPSLGVAAGHTLQWINPTAATSAIHTLLQARHVPRCYVRTRKWEIMFYMLHVPPFKIVI